MKKTDWILLTTVTTGYAQPVMVVEIAAQRMHGWESVGPAFSRLLDHSVDIPAAVTRQHGYTRETLAMDGEPATAVYAALQAYVGGLELVTPNPEQDWDQVLLPEWKRLGVAEIGTRGFGAVNLIRRSLDPLQAADCKMDTLRQYYQLPEQAEPAISEPETAEIRDTSKKPTTSPFFLKAIQNGPKIKIANVKEIRPKKLVRELSREVCS